MKKSFYVVINASNGTIVNNNVYLNKLSANAVCDRLCEIACNPNSYYVQPLSLI